MTKAGHGGDARSRRGQQQWEQSRCQGEAAEVVDAELHLEPLRRTGLVDRHGSGIVDEEVEPLVLAESASRHSGNRPHLPLYRWPTQSPAHAYRNHHHWRPTHQNLQPEQVGTPNLGHTPTQHQLRSDLRKHNHDQTIPESPASRRSQASYTTPPTTEVQSPAAGGHSPLVTWL